MHQNSISTGLRCVSLHSSTDPLTAFKGFYFSGRREGEGKEGKGAGACTQVVRGLKALVVIDKHVWLKQQMKWDFVVSYTNECQAMEDNNKLTLSWYNSKLSSDETSNKSALFILVLRQETQKLFSYHTTVSNVSQRDQSDLCYSCTRRKNKILAVFMHASEFYHWIIAEGTGRYSIPTAAVTTKPKSTAGRVGLVHDFWVGRVNRNVRLRWNDSGGNLRKHSDPISVWSAALWDKNHPS